MNNSDKLNEIIKQIEKANTISLYCHQNPDGDTLSSALALFIILKKMGKNAEIFCEDDVPIKYLCFKNSELISKPKKVVFDLAIAIDCAEIDRLGYCSKSYLNAKYTMAIDHHKSHKRFSDFYFVDESACATAEIIFELASLLELMDNDIAKLIFAGIVTDSGCFSFSNVTTRTHQIAGKLIEFEFDKTKVINSVFKSQSKNVFALKNRVLDKAKFFEDDQIGLLTFTKEDFLNTNTNIENTEGIINNLIDINTVKVAISITEVNSKSFKVSFRTKHNTVDASDCAGVFGGGGHINAAGCRLNGYYEDVIEKLIKVARDRL